MVARIYGHNHLSTVAPYIAQYVLVLLAPILYAAAIYMFLGRLMRVSGHPELSFIRINWITKIFVAGDVLCFLVQAFGGASIATLVNSDKPISEIQHRENIAENVILAGIGLQVLFFLMFALCAVIFHIRVSRPQFAKTVDPTIRLNLLLYTLYACSLLVTVRNIYKVVEYKTGTDGYLQTNEWPGYAFDVALMALVQGITVYWYSADTKARLTGKGKYGVIGEGADKDWSHDISSQEFPLTQGAYAPAGPAPTYAHDTSYSNAYGNTYYGGHGYTEQGYGQAYRST